MRRLDAACILRELWRFEGWAVGGAKKEKGIAKAASSLRTPKKADVVLANSLHLLYNGKGDISHNSRRDEQAHQQRRIVLVEQPMDEQDCRKKTTDHARDTVSPTNVSHRRRRNGASETRVGVSKSRKLIQLSPPNLVTLE